MRLVAENGIFFFFALKQPPGYNEPKCLLKQNQIRFFFF